MNDRQEIYKLHELKKILREKQDKSLESKIRISELENELKQLELQRKKIINRKRRKIESIMFYAIYNLVICLILMIFISLFIDRFELASSIQKTIYIIEIYAGVTLISVIGALTSARIGDSIKKSFSNRITVLSNQIDMKEKEIKIERDRREIIEKELTIIFNGIYKENDLTKLKQKETEILDTQCYDYEGIRIEENIRPYSKIRINDKYENNN